MQIASILSYFIYAIATLIAMVILALISEGLNPIEFFKFLFTGRVK